MSQIITRRRSIQSMTIAALACSLNGFSNQAFADDAKAIGIAQWLDQLDRNAAQLGAGKISGLQWQETMDLIYRDTPLESLREHVQFKTLQRTILDKITESDRNELFHNVDLNNGKPLPNGREPHRKLIAKVAHVKKGHSIPPHGHSNMVSAFLCLSGEFDVRLYDKLEDSEEAMVVRQTADARNASVGTWSSISDYRNNVHWLTAKTDDCYLFTCKMISVEKDRKLHGRINIDVQQGSSLGSNTLRAPKITFKEAAERY